jgi:hypothetical protein
MAISVVCSKCKTEAQVPDSAAGAKGKCRVCGSIVVVPSKSLKTCVGCGADVSQTKRIKDERSHYLCEKCHAQRTQAPRSTSGDATTPQEMMTCPDCGGMFNMSAMDAGGVCRECASQSATKVTSASPEKKSSALSRFLRGGIPGLIDERNCISAKDITVDGSRTKRAVTKRLLKLGLIAFACFVLLVGIIVGAALLGGPWLSSDSSNSSSPSADAPSLPAVSNITFPEFDSKFSTYSNTTELQKKQLIAEYKGKRVHWQGIVADVSYEYVLIQHKVTTLSYDVQLTVLDSEKAKLPTLHKGDLITYEGTINDFGTILAHSLQDGRILASQAMSSDEQRHWLTTSEADAIKPITDEDEKREKAR